MCEVQAPVSGAAGGGAWPRLQAQRGCVLPQDDDRYEQASDVRAQLKFFEQLDQIEKQRKDEQEREILMRAAKASVRRLTRARAGLHSHIPPGAKGGSWAQWPGRAVGSPQVWLAPCGIASRFLVSTRAMGS